ncbi:hypothetical protein CS006_10400 [Bifidobacterium primatium]|uniref:Uncharacterized protein n=1 Tax=Bifidobacterium primatium TaxID=2045438 RepID=A0A2M9H699_9BIFI|nr:hypothetical protein [Bifidobacterium primatium]PJM72338.1 hypothetical protein CS006_10400 [Bifidobacterium primatium]
MSLLVNGGFESGSPSPWTGGSVVGASDASWISPYEGEWMLRSGQPFSQQVTLPAGTKMGLSYAANSYDKHRVTRLRVDFDTGDPWIVDVAGIDDQWHVFQHEIPVPSGATTATLTVSPSNGYVRYDAFTLTPLS